MPSHDSVALPEAAPDAHLSPVQRQRSAAALELGSAGGQMQPNDAAGYLMLAPERWDLLISQCKVMVEGGGIHSSINTPAKAAAIALKGIEMGIPLMAAWSGMRIIDGEITVLGKLALRLIYQRAIPLGATCQLCEVSESDKSERAGWLMGRPGKKPLEYWFTMDDAEKAGLLRIFSRKQDKWIDTPVYKHYPWRMLRWRALAEGAAYEFQDIMQGCLLAEELSHRDPEFIEAQLVESGEKPQPPKPTFYDQRTQRVELDREHPEVAKCRDLIGEHALQRVRSAALELGELDVEDNPHSDAAKTQRRALWAELGERCIGGEAPTFGEARMIQGILEERIRRHKDVIRNLELAHLEAADKAARVEADAEVENPPTE